MHINGGHVIIQLGAYIHKVLILCGYLFSVAHCGYNVYLHCTQASAAISPFAPAEVKATFW